MSVGPAILLVVTAILAFWVRWLLSRLPSSDETVALWMVTRQRGRQWVNTEVSDSLVRGWNGYPVLLHWLIAKLPRRMWGSAGTAINFASDFVVAMGVLVVAWHLASIVGPRDAAFTPIDVGLVAALLYLTSPILLLPVSARVRGMSARAFGGVLVALYAAALIWGMIWAPLEGAIAMALTLALILFTSQFGLQVAIFFSVLIALFEWSVFPIVVPAATIALLCLVRPTRARHILRHALNHKLWYFRNALARTTVSARNRLVDYRYLFGPDFHRQLKKGIPGAKRRLARLLTRSLVLAIALYSTPVVFATLILGGIGGEGFVAATATEMGRFLWHWTLSGIIVFALVCYPALGFLGEAERYLEYAAPPASILLAVSLLQTSPMWWLAIVALLIMAHLTVFFWLMRMEKMYFPRNSAVHQREELDMVAKFLAQSEEPLRIVTIPFKNAFGLSVNMAEKGRQESYLYYFISQEGALGFPYMNAPDAESEHPHFEVPPYTPIQLREIWNANVVTVDRSWIKHMGAFWGAAQGLLEAPIFETERFIVVDISVSGANKLHPEHGVRPKLNAEKR